ncbi:hypothetical protein QTP70_011222, partial [Hemibagrus guttatus]
MAAFTQLKRSFTTVPILQHPYPSCPFIIEVDASSCGIGAVPSQCHGDHGKVYPFTFFSWKLTPAKCSHPFTGTSWKKFSSPDQQAPTTFLPGQ